MAGDHRERLHEDARPSTGEPAGYGSPSGVYERIEVTVPDIGDFADVPVIEVHIAPGDTVAAEDPLITLESDKATMDIPAPDAGTIVAVRVAVGDSVSAGHVIADLDTGQRLSPPSASVADVQAAQPAAAGQSPAAQSPAAQSPAAQSPAAQSPAAQSQAPRGRGDVHAEVLVLGAGPGGYTAAFRAADLGQQVVLVDQRPTLGGVCLNVGCIPSKALLHAARVIAETAEMAAHGLRFGDPDIDLDALRGWKDGVVTRLTGGLAGLARQRKVRIVPGTGRFTAPDQVAVTGDDGAVTTVALTGPSSRPGRSRCGCPSCPRATRG